MAITHRVTATATAATISQAMATDTAATISQVTGTRTLVQGSACRLAQAEVALVSEATDGRTATQVMATPHTGGIGTKSGSP